VRVEGRFAVGGNGDLIDICVFKQRGFELGDDALDCDRVALLLNRCGRGQFAVEAVEIALFVARREVDAQ
jgi:hypothetical protein